MNVVTKRPFEVRGWHVLAMLLAFFALVIAVNVAFAVLALRSFPGEDVRRSYLQGLQYNDTLAERRAQAALGWRIEVGQRAGALEVFANNRNGEPLDRLTVQGELQRRADARFDRSLTFEHVGAGRYVARVEDLAPGAWRLRARAEDGQGEALDFESELIWAKQR